MTATARLSRPVSMVGLPVLGCAAGIGLWHAGIAAFDIAPYVAPTPSQVVAVYADLPVYLLDQAWITLLEAVIGFALTAVLAITAGAGLAASRLLREAVWPNLVALHAAPKVAFAPLLVVWWGFGPAPKVAMVVIMCFFPVVLATTTGLTSTPVELVELAASLSASRWRTFTKIRLRAGLPQIFTGLKTAMPLAVIGAVLGELLGATGGLGFVIVTAGSDAALVFAAIGLLAAISIVLFYALTGVERLVAPWTRYVTS